MTYDFSSKISDQNKSVTFSRIFVELFRARFDFYENCSVFAKLSGLLHKLSVASLYNLVIFSQLPSGVDSV